MGWIITSVHEELPWPRGREVFKGSSFTLTVFVVLFFFCFLLKKTLFPGKPWIQRRKSTGAHGSNRSRLRGSEVFGNPSNRPIRYPATSGPVEGRCDDFKGSQRMGGLLWIPPRKLHHFLIPQKWWFFFRKRWLLEKTCSKPFLVTN